MPMQKLALKPGIDTQSTALLTEAGWQTSQLIRWQNGFLQKLLGWALIVAAPLTGTPRALLAFEDLDGNQYIASGSEQKLQLYTAGNLYDITPVDSTANLTNPFSTTISLFVITVHDVAHGATAGDWINVVTPASIDGLLIQGEYQVVTVVDVDHYTIISPIAATGTVGGGGTTALFTTTNTSTTVQVTLNNHGLAALDAYTVYVSTVVGGLTFLGSYVVDAVLDANNFTFINALAASSNDTGYENGGSVRVEYLLPNGNASTMNSVGFYGAGPYGAGPYGIGNIVVVSPVRLWSLGAWGEDLAASYTNGPVFIWLPGSGLISNPATDIGTSPRNIQAGIFIAMPEQQIVALGSSVGSGSTTDQLLVRWCNIADYTDWTATAINQAGSFRIPRGSRIVGGIQGPQQGLIWTDLGLWVMQYVGFPLVYGFNEVAEGCGLIGQKAVGILAGQVLWMGVNGFFRFDGNSVQPVQCAVWDAIFRNLNSFQAQKIIAAPNSSFNEMWWFYPSAGSDEVDSYVKLNILNGLWDYGTLERTAWIDQSIFGQPIGVDADHVLQQHEISADANGLPMHCYARSGWLKIADGTFYTFIERIIPDFIYDNATMLVTLYFADYPNGPTSTFGPFSCTDAINYIIVRGRGRLVSIQIESNDLGSFWRLGEILYQGAPAGRR